MFENLKRKIKLLFSYNYREECAMEYGFWTVDRDGKVSFHLFNHKNLNHDESQIDLIHKIFAEEYENKKEATLITEFADHPKKPIKYIEYYSSYRVVDTIIDIGPVDIVLEKQEHIPERIKISDYGKTWFLSFEEALMHI